VAPPLGISASSPALNEPAPYVKPGNVTVNFKDADIRAVFRYLSEVSGVDIVPTPDVTGSVTLALNDKPWEVALDIIVKNYGFAYEREGGIIRVVTLTSLKLEELSTEVIPLNYATAEKTQEAVKDMLTERGKMTYDDRINALVVTDLATNIYKIKRVISNLDKKTPQIMIEAKIIETTLTKAERMGIDWNLVIAASGAARPITLPFTNWGNIPYFSDDFRKYLPFGQTGAPTGAQSGASEVITTAAVADFPVMPGANTAFPFVTTDQFAFGTLNFTQFSAVLQYLKQRSDIDIIATPRITTLNNKQAKMFVGRVHPYISKIDENEEKGTAKYEYKEKEIGIRLQVTPHINQAGDIDVELKPEIKDIVGYQALTEWFSLPIFSTREAETHVMMKDGDTVFIGGLIKEHITEGSKKFPILGDLIGDIPIIGKPFKYTVETEKKTELVFFLTVHVVKNFADMNKRISDELSEVEIPESALKDREAVKEVAGDDVFIELQPATDSPTLKKTYRPLFDFRKKK